MAAWLRLVVAIWQFLPTYLPTVSLDEELDYGLPGGQVYYIVYIAYSCIYSYLLTVDLCRIFTVHVNLNNTAAPSRHFVFTLSIFTDGLATFFIAKRDIYFPIILSVICSTKKFIARQYRLVRQVPRQVGTYLTYVIELHQGDGGKQVGTPRIKKQQQQ